MKSRVIVLVSGGIDSVTALYHCHERYTVVAALSFDYGSKHNNKEIPFALLHSRHLGIRHELIPLTFIGKYFKSALLKTGNPIPKGHYQADNMKKTVVPFRNGIFLSIAGGYAESVQAQAVVIAAHGGDHAIYPDCREEFMTSMTAALQKGTYKGVKILRPFIDLMKCDIVRRGKRLGIDFEQTWSCYNGGVAHCGTCGTCVERREAFILAGQVDPTRYIKTTELPKLRIKTTRKVVAKQ